MALPPLPAQRTLLLLSSRLHAQMPFVLRLGSLGWQVHHFADLPSLKCFLHDRDDLVAAAGLIDLRDLGSEEAVGELTPVLSHPRLGCVAMTDARTIADDSMRQLVRDCCFDFVTLPCPDDVLDTVIGHAFGLAWLGRGTTYLPHDDAGFGGMVGESPEMRSLFRLLRLTASNDAPVFIAGETGTGKELAAMALHEHSARAGKPFITIHCESSAPGALLSMLAGHEQQRGRIESAHRGTLFLDEADRLPLDSQAMLLGLLETGRLMKPGAEDGIPVDVRVISASHHDLEAAVAEGRFRADLYHRLSVLRLQLPALRERGEDIEHIAHHARMKYASKYGRRIKGFSPCALRQLQAHAWPGNVRELHNRVRQAVIKAEGRYISASDLGLNNEDALPALTLDEARAGAERDAILTALRRNRHRIGESARELGVSRVTLYRLMNRHGMRAAC